MKWFYMDESVFLLIVLEHTAIAKTVNVAMESMIGRQREALIRLGPYSIANYLFTHYVKQRSMPTYLRIGLALNYDQNLLIIGYLF